MVMTSDMQHQEEEIRSRFEVAGQAHVFQYWSDLSISERHDLLQQLAGIKVEDISSLLQHALAEQENLATASTVIRPFPKPIGESSDVELARQSREVGLQAIQRGEVVALVLAGGQGTRLGFEGPKGMYDIGLPSHKSLFQLLAERIRKLCQLASVDRIPFYLMTSPLNHQETIAYFKSESYFGLDPSSVHFFQQGMLPCLDNDGKIIMETPSTVAMAPDGNGGIYPSLQASGALDEMISNGAKYLHVFSIDNVLVKPADPVFMGYCISQNADCGNKVVWKTEAHEKVGVMAERDGHACIVEYSDISIEMAEQFDTTAGRLVYGAANICNHFYTTEFLINVVLQQMGDMYHVARKKIPHYDPATKETVTPESNNGIKLETFIFDVFPLAKNMAVLDVDRDEEFAPVKNAPPNPVDSPDSARILMSKLCQRWVRQAGGILVDCESGGFCEISPLTSYAGEGLEELVEGKEILCPFSL
jgi:UDP-N-acetylglucosamine/UDP-N-acetylgalactosamine diphosphorylase